MSPTITVVQDPIKPVITMTWQRRIEKEDVVTAFAQINQWLDDGKRSQWVIVDLRENPIFPMLETITQAMKGPYQNKLFVKWLVVNGNPMAKTIERVLSHTTGIKKVEWFETMDDAIAYLDEANNEKSRPA